MKWNRFLAGLGLAVAMTFVTSARAESYYGSGDLWGGLYGTGGYNLLDFGLDIYNTGSYLGSNYGYDSWGGGCGSFYSTCSSPYSTSGLYGSDWGMTPYLYGYGSGLSIDINININLYLGGLYSAMPYGYGYGYGSGYGSGGYDVGCSIGYCSGGSSYPWMYPFGYDTYGYGNNSYGSNYYSNLWGSNPYGLPGMYFPIDININPWTNGSYTPPTSIPPYGSCGGLIPCPTGPITRNDPPVYQYPPVNPPVYQPQDQVSPNDPIRYRVPRGVTTH